LRYHVAKNSRGKEVSPVSTKKDFDFFYVVFRVFVVGNDGDDGVVNKQTEG